MVNISEGPPPTKLLYPLIMWSHVVIGQIKNDTSPHLRGPWPPNLTMWWLMMRGHRTWWPEITKQMKNVTSLFLKSYDKQK